MIKYNELQSIFDILIAKFRDRSIDLWLINLCIKKYLKTKTKTNSGMATVCKSDF